jgi:hypothetical protein
MPASDKGTLQFAMSYDLNVLETLKTGRQTLEDDARSRRTHSALFEMGYSFSDKWSIDAFFSFVRQEREIRQFGNRNFSATNGIGDAVLLLKYKIGWNTSNSSLLQIGIGPKIPLGASDKTNSIGLTLNADLQPGSGAWDGILLVQYSQIMSFRPSMSWLSTLTYSKKGKNKDYFGVQVYQFGNEFQFQMGLSDRILLGKAIIDPAISFQYRNQRADKIDGEILPSTGGNWLFLNPTLAYWINTNISFNIGITLPLYANITGTQVTPTYRFNTGVFYKLGTKTNEKRLIQY